MIVTFRIKEIRKRMGYSVRDLADITGVKRSHLSDIENNKTNPSILTLLHIAQALKEPVDNLYKVDYD